MKKKPKQRAKKAASRCSPIPAPKLLVAEGALAAIEYQSARKVLPWWRKDAQGWPIETFKGKPVKSAIRIICQNIRKVIFKPNKQ